MKRMRPPAVKKKPGRKTKYMPYMTDMAFRLCAYLGARQEDLAKVFQVDVTTIEHWLRTNTEFRDAVERGRLFVGAKVAQALVKKALGCTVPHTIHCSHKGNIYTREIQKHLPPDPYAAHKYLSIMFRDIWADSLKVDMSGTIKHRKVEDIPLNELSKEEQELVFSLAKKQILSEPGEN